MNTTNTFNEVAKGDLVIRRGKHAADVRIIEDITKHNEINRVNSSEDQISILLVNGQRDLSYEGEKDILRFNSSWRLFAKKDNLIEV